MQFQGALKQSPLETDDVFLKQNLVGLSQKSFNSILHVLFYRFLRIFYNTVGELQHLLPLYPTLIFRGVLKKALMIPENRSH